MAAEKGAINEKDEMQAVQPQDETGGQDCKHGQMGMVRQFYPYPRPRTMCVTEKNLQSSLS